jgi:hypothetical protein
MSANDDLVSRTLCPSKHFLVIQRTVESAAHYGIITDCTRSRSRADLKNTAHSGTVQPFSNDDALVFFLVAAAGCRVTNVVLAEFRMWGADWRADASWSFADTILTGASGIQSRTCMSIAMNVATSCFSKLDTATYSFFRPEGP